MINLQQLVSRLMGGAFGVIGGVIVAGSLSLAPLAFAQNKKRSVAQEPACATPQAAAQELLRAEAVGWRSSRLRPACLQQKDFQHLLVSVSDTGGSDGEAAPRALDEMQPTKVMSLRPIETGLYELEFVWRFRLQANSVSEVRDKLQFRIYGPAAARSFGCVGLVAEPQYRGRKPSCELK